MINRLFLPIASGTIDAVLSESVIDEADEAEFSVIKSNTFQNLTLHELASLYLLNLLPELNRPSNLSLEKKLHEIIHLARDYDDHPGKRFVDEIAARFSRTSIRQGRDLARECNIYLLPDTDVKNEEFLDASGNWDYEFKGKYRHPEVQEKVTIALPSGLQREMFSNQHRIFRQIERSVSDEHLQIEGYAGTGKTHMLSAISEILVRRNKRTGKNVLALTNSTTQLQALRLVVHSSVRTLTFGQLASMIIPAGNYPNYKRLKRTSLDNSANPIRAIAEALGLKSIGGLSPNRVSSILFQMVARYCWSRNNEITVESIPKWVSRLTPEDEAYLLSHATLLWELVINPPSNFLINIPVRDFHVIKHASLQRYVIPSDYSHLIVDESHDLSEAMLDIIERSWQGYIGLGDSFQAVNSFTAKRKSPAIDRQMSTSIRTPGKLGRIVNFSLDLHALPVKDEFVANRERSSKIEYYDRPDVPLSPTAIWVDDLWELFEWAERLSALKLSYRVLGSDAQLDEFVRGCIGLYRDKKPAKVIGLSSYYDWSSVINRNRRHRSVLHINKLFEKGYKTQHWEETKRLQSQSAQYVIGLFQNARNHEFDSVMLAPAIIQQLYDVKKSMASHDKDVKAARSSLASRLYLGITRSRHTLILPQSFEEFMHFL